MTVSLLTVYTLLYLGMCASYRTKHKPSHAVILLAAQIHHEEDPVTL